MLGLVTCCICGLEFKQIHARHLERHGLSVAEYKSLYPEAELRSEETKELHARAIKEAINTPKAKERASKTSSEVWLRPEVRERRLKVHKEAMNRPETREKQAKSSREVQNRPEIRERIIEAKKIAHNTPEAKERQSKASKQGWLRPGVKEKHSQALKEAQNRPEARIRVRNQMLSEYASGRRKLTTHGYSKYVKFLFPSGKELILRSTWEYAVIKWLVDYNIEVEYEACGFQISERTYYPDFYLPIHNLWIEVKGYAWLGFAEIWKVFSQDRNTLLIDESFYKNLDVNLRQYFHAHFGMCFPVIPSSSECFHEEAIAAE